jgi:hypothetical protein
MARYRLLPYLMLASWCAVCAAQQKSGDVFVVGEQTATEGLIRPFEKTHVELPKDPLSEFGRRDLVRMLLAEQGFAQRPLPVGPPGLTLVANGSLKPDSTEMRRRLYEKGIASGQGDRVQVTDVQIARDHIVLDLNGGPYPKHRFLRHLEVNGMRVGGDPYEQATGARIILEFEGGVPELSAAEVKLLLEPLLDFGVKSSVEAYAETLPAPIREAVQAHEVLVGMTRRMVMASLGQPEIKMRERANGGADGAVTEEWIYGKVPQTMRFVRFNGDRVVLLKVAALGKPLEIHDKNEMAGYVPPRLEHVVRLGDTEVKPGEDKQQAKPPSLKTGDEAKAAGPGEMGPVQMPKARQDTKSVPPAAPADPPSPAKPQMVL